MEHILLAERALLYTLAFDLSVDHPYTHLTAAIKKLNLIVDGTIERKFFQCSQNMLNDRCLTGAQQIQIPGYLHAPQLICLALDLHGRFVCLSRSRRLNLPCS